MIGGINHLTLSIADIGRTIRFYRDVLGLRLVASWATGAYFTAGPTWMAFRTEALADRKPASEYTHIAFSVSEADFEVLSMRIIDSGATIWQPNTTEGDSLYFLDPDGHKLEIHSSSLANRIEYMRSHPWAAITFY